MLAIIGVFCFWCGRIPLLLFRWRCSFLQVRTDRGTIRIRCCYWSVVDIIDRVTFVIWLDFIIFALHWSFHWHFYFCSVEESIDRWLYHDRRYFVSWFIGFWAFFGLVLIGEKLVSRCCLSWFIFRRADLMTFFAITIHVANELLFNLENSEISLANYLYYSWRMPLTCFWRVSASWTISWCIWLLSLLSVGVDSWMRLQYFLQSTIYRSIFSFINEFIHNEAVLLDWDRL